MPEWKVHYKWEEMLLGRRYREIEEFIDFPQHYELDMNCLETAFGACRDKMLSLQMESLVYSALGEPWRINSSIELFKEMLASRLSIHDIYRDHEELVCPLLMYVYCKYGEEGFRAAVLHMFLDEMAKYRKAGVLVVLEQLEFIRYLLKRKLPARQAGIAEQVYRGIKENLKEIYNDIAGEPLQPIVRATIIYDPEEADRELMRKLEDVLLKIGARVDKICVRDISGSGARQYEDIIHKIAEDTRTSYKRRNNHKLIRYNEDNNRLEILGGILVIIEYGGDSRIFYPHYIVFGKEKRLIRVDDLVRLLGEAPLA